jgi:ribosomal protein S18 acetylase RimI-like enzyme
MPEIRPYRASDRPAVADICVRTGDNGGDSRAVFTDLELLPSIFAYPYVDLEPESAFVLDDGGRAVGYILGCADTPAFARRFRTEYLPTVSYPAPTAAPSNPTEQMIALLHDPERMVIPEVTDYPAHLHIDLLPPYQRSGHGRALITRLLSTLHARNVDAIHLVMLTTNTPAGAFYRRLGFHPIAVPNITEVTYLGRSTAIG